MQEWTDMCARKKESRHSVHASGSASGPCSVTAPHAGNAEQQLNGIGSHANKEFCAP